MLTLTEKPLSPIVGFCTEGLRECTESFCEESGGDGEPDCTCYRFCCEDHVRATPSER